MSLTYADLLAPTSRELAQWAQSQHQEDLFILGLLDGKAAPFVVDVGANNGQAWSNSYLFGKLGYELLLIEPMPAYAEMCRALYAGDPKVQVVESAVSTERGEASFFLNLDAEADLLAMRSSLERGEVPGGRTEEIRVRVERLDDILERCGCPADYALLSIDAEGRDPEVLKSTDLDRFRPQVICIEEEAFGGRIRAHLEEAGYEFVSRLGPNGIYRRKQPGPRPTYHSKFGGLWIDRSDFSDRLADKRKAGEIAPDMVRDLEAFERDGYLILKGAADGGAIDRFESAISSAFRKGSDCLLFQSHDDPTNRLVEAGMSRRRKRIVDSYACLPEALDLFASPRLIAFLKALFETDPLLFQSLSFDMGSEQGLHQDPAYVVVGEPLRLAACWIALEDVRPGSGELMYVPGSHRLPDFDFGGNKKHWNAVTDGHEPHERWCYWLIEETARRGLKPQTFLPKKGDILIWHADLAHGGSPITNPDVTRKSLVGHFCPLGVAPNYFYYREDRRTARWHGELAYSSEHFEL